MEGHPFRRRGACRGIGLEEVAKILRRGETVDAPVIGGDVRRSAITVRVLQAREILQFRLGEFGSGSGGIHSGDAGALCGSRLLVFAETLVGVVPVRVGRGAENLDRKSVV